MFRRLWDTLFARTKPPATAAPATDSAPAAPATDYAGDRETNRTDRMSAEDQAWEAASRQRSQDTEARDQANRLPPE